MSGEKENIEKKYLQWSFSATCWHEYYVEGFSYSMFLWRLHIEKGEKRCQVMMPIGGELNAGSVLNARWKMSVLMSVVGHA